MTAFLFLESMGKKKHIFVKSSRFLATVWLQRGMEIAQNAVYNSTRRLHSVTKFSYLYVQKAKFWPVALSLPSSLPFLVSLITTQQFNNHTISSMTIAVEKIATSTSDFY